MTTGRLAAETLIELRSEGKDFTADSLAATAASSTRASS